MITLRWDRKKFYSAKSQWMTERKFWRLCTLNIEKRHFSALKVDWGKTLTSRSSQIGSHKTRCAKWRPRAATRRLGSNLNELVVASHNRTRGRILVSKQLVPNLRCLVQTKYEQEDYPLETWCSMIVFSPKSLWGRNSFRPGLTPNLHQKHWRRSCGSTAAGVV